MQSWQLYLLVIPCALVVHLIYTLSALWLQCCPEVGQYKIYWHAKASDLPTYKMLHIVILIAVLQTIIIIIIIMNHNTSIVNYKTCIIYSPVFCLLCAQHLCANSLSYAQAELLVIRVTKSDTLIILLVCSIIASSSHKVCYLDL